MNPATQHRSENYLKAKQKKNKQNDSKKFLEQNSPRKFFDFMKEIKQKGRKKITLTKKMPKKTGNQEGAVTKTSKKQLQTY